MALFGEKYGESVRVVKMGDFSMELCGGTHVPNTGVIRAFKIISEGGVAAGVRRIEALTSKAVFDYYKNIEKNLISAAKSAKAEPSQLVKKIESLTNEIKGLKSENDKLKNKLAKDSLGDVLNNVIKIKDVNLLTVKLENTDMDALRNLGDSLKEKIDNAVIVLAAVNDGKVNLIAMASDEAVKLGAHAGNIIKAAAACVGGGGGGRLIWRRPEERTLQELIMRSKKQRKCLKVRSNRIVAACQVLGSIKSYRTQKRLKVITILPGE